MVTERLTSAQTASSAVGSAGTSGRAEQSSGMEITRSSYSQIVNTNSTGTQSAKLDSKTRFAVLTAMHTEEQSKRRRSNNLVVTGMPTSGIASDADRFVELCVEEFNRQPIVRSTSRLGNIISGKVQLLLICLESSEDASFFIDRAKNLRNSSNKVVRDNVYINRHMTRTEANAAYEARRTKRLKNQTTSNSPSTGEKSDEPEVTSNDQAPRQVPTESKSSSATNSGAQSTGVSSQLDPNAHPFSSSQPN